MPYAWMIDFNAFSNADAELTNQDMTAIKKLDKDQKKTKDDVSLWHSLFGPCCEKTCLRGFRQSETQISLLSYGD